MASEGLHESADLLQPETVERHRALSSIIEELEAVDWYDQRVDATTDPELAGILAHNRDEEKEHAVMVLEWLRRRDPAFDRMLRTYVFTEGSVLDVEEHATGHGDAAEDGTPAPDDRAPGAPGGGGDGTGSLGIGSLKGKGSL